MGNVVVSKLVGVYTVCFLTSSAIAAEQFTFVGVRTDDKGVSEAAATLCVDRKDNCESRVRAEFVRMREAYLSPANLGSERFNMGEILRVHTKNGMTDWPNAAEEYFRRRPDFMTKADLSRLSPNSARRTTTTCVTQSSSTYGVYTGRQTSTTTCRSN